VNLAKNLARSAHLHADRVAVRLGDQGTTYRELDERSRRVAGLLAERGVRAGDRVGIMLANIPDFAAVYYGVLRAGAVVVPMNPLLKAREVTHYLADSGAAVIFTGAMSAAEVLAGAATVDAQVVVVDATFTEMLSTATPVDGVVDRDGSDTR
jgi:long-chain acyl-CoA synthetase